MVIIIILSVVVTLTFWSIVSLDLILSFESSYKITDEDEDETVKEIIDNYTGNFIILILALVSLIPLVNVVFLLIITSCFIGEHGHLTVSEIREKVKNFFIRRKEKSNDN